MKKIRIYNIISILFFLFCAAIPSGLRAECVALITDVNQLSSNSVNDGDSHAKNLIDNNTDTWYFSREGEWLNEDPYIEVSLNNPLNLGDNEDLLVYVRRHRLKEGCHPTTFRVSGSIDGANWEDFCHIYLLYRGQGTHEFSSKIKPEKAYTKLRFTATANNTREHYNGHRYMGMSEFQIYKIGKNDSYPYNFKDRLHLNTDYSLNYWDWQFENTHGPLDSRNKIENWDWPGDEDKELLEKNGISLPDFDFLTTGRSGQKRQPVHTTEHELYAIPGDAIALYPYYQLTTTSNFYENFSHWYDYDTGGRIEHEVPGGSGEKVDLLDFLTDPSRVIKTNEIGYLAGKDLQGEERKYGDVVNVANADEYIAFVNRVNGGETRLCMNITADLDFNGRNDVNPMGTSGNPFCGYINGNGHTIRNLRIVRNGEGVGIVGNGGNNLVICNLVVDASCHFEGTSRIALVANGRNSAAPIRFANVSVLASFKGNGTPSLAAVNVAGFHGCAFSGGLLMFENCFFGGTVEGVNDCAAFSGWVGNNHSDHRLKNCYNAGNVNGTNKGSWNNNLINTSASIEVLNGMLDNCYSINKSEYPESNIKQLEPGYDFDRFKGEYGFNAIVADKSISNLDRSHGTVATFLYPRNPYVKEGILQDLPQEYVIAADFSQTYSAARNKVDGEKKFVEPTLAFRHIFRIKSGKTFAEEFSGSKEANEEYIRKHMRHVTARSGVPFQIRFDSPVPKWENKTTPPPSKYYYKISETDYRRVRAMDIVVLDATTRQPTNEISFDAGEDFDGQGSRTIDGVTYKICGGGGSYHRMLMCSNPKEGRYIVQLIGKDINNNRIKIIGTDDDLVVMEYMINFVPETAASMVTEKELYDNPKYEHAREEVLEEKYGEPKDAVTFDEYKAFEGTPVEKKYIYDNSGKKYYKWPVVWENSTYAFGYNNRQDYNMYMLGSHSSITPYHVAADLFKDNYGEGTGLYDRLFYKTRRQHQQDPEKYPASTIDRGYFYYVNAATDPGVMAKLRVEELCLGSTIHVSAWVAEFSQTNETANIAFNFIAVLKNTGQRVPLHSFVSGYVPGGDNEPKSPDLRGQWLNIYYSFVPDFSETGLTSDMVDHYELELDNNCKNSDGADYAIDNIRVYIVQPVIYATQMTLACDEKINKPAVKVQTPFSVLLQTIGETETTQKSDPYTLYYTFIDKKVFDENFAKYESEGKENPGELAYNDAVLRYNYRGNSGGVTNFGKLTFNLHYESNPEYMALNPDDLTPDKIDSVTLRDEASRELGDGNERMIVFNTLPDDSNMTTGKEYYIALATDEKSGQAWVNPGWNAFNIVDPCAKVCVFRVRPASVVKIDGFIANDIDNLRCCENQSPVVQVDLYGQNDNGDIVAVDKNAYFDWFEGTTAEYNSIKEGDLTLAEAMIKFRFLYPDAESIDGVAPSISGEQFTQAMIDLIKKYTTVAEGETRAKLLLHKSSYVFPPVKFENGEEEKDLYILAVPIEREQKKVDGEGNIKICAAPTEVKMHVDHSSPKLAHGLKEGIIYPQGMDDVPLRVSLKQLNKVSAPASSTGHADFLNIPVRTVKSSGAEGATVTSLRLKKDTDSPIYLVETNDPYYKDLGTVGTNGNDNRGLLEIGEIKHLTANVKDNGDNMFKAMFDSSFKFKEGYYYRMRFMYEEDAEDKKPEDGEEEPVVCDGQDVFTIKVVPEYQKWTGKENFNWNNDLNWSRVTSADLYRAQNDNDEYVTDGSNGRTFSYAPLDFTKVIVENNGEEYPYLYDMETTDLDFADLPDENDKTSWPENPSEVKGETTAYPYFPESGVGDATRNIQYDMAGYDPKGKPGVNCRSWYANTCEQIHFKPESAIMNQQYLTYRKAWVDMELSPSRWYTLASPLQEVYAGDMYLPSDNARQETELFNDITFSYGTNHRFKPAVFQRGWNRASTTVYELPVSGGGTGKQNNVAVKANWSHVFNDVREVYGAGNGFSLKTDVSAVKDSVGNVLFRLPKNDSFFDYYNQAGDIQGDSTQIERGEGHYRLNKEEGTLTSTTVSGNRYFLIGNPFMTHLDMKEFLKANEDLIEPKYWMVTNGRQQAAVFDETSDGFIGEDKAGMVAPMQGFFVEAKDNAAKANGDSQTLVLSYDSGMMARGSFADNGIRLLTRGEDSQNFLRVTAENDGNLCSEAVVRISPEANKGYASNEDAMAIDHSEIGMEALVYTVAGDKAVSVNCSSDAEGMEIGVIAGDNTVTVFTFDGVDNVNGKMLYDAADNSYTDLYDGMQYEVKGNVSGRLFLTAGMERDTFDTLKWNLSGNVLTITSGKDGGIIDAKIYDMAGRLIVADSVNGSELAVTLDSGIYIFEATDGNNNINGKLLVK